jgi:hypothetical protein
MKLRIAGLDPSLSNFGIVKAFVDTDTLELNPYDLILVKTAPEKDKATRKQVRKNSEDLERARLLHKGMMTNLTDVALAFAEVPVGSQSARAMASYGVCLGILAACPVPLIQVTPTEVKMAAIGKPDASKLEMIAWATGKYPEAPWLRYDRNGKTYKKGDIADANEHLADATAAIEAGLRTDQYKQAAAFWAGMRIAA